MIDTMAYSKFSLPINQDHFDQLIHTLNESNPSSWEEISEVISQIARNTVTSQRMSQVEFLQLVSTGTAFITFDYGIDGVSIEISKYARALQNLLRDQGEANLHFIGGDFYHQAESVLLPEWHRFQIDGINGWSKWEEGKWFAKLFYEDMPTGSENSEALASEMYRQAVSIAQRLGQYLVDHSISLLIPVNIASNPGNLALTIALVMVTEGLGIYTLNSNHDFYWDGGKPASQRTSDEPPGVRDHFFRNVENEPFFRLFTSLYPWHGSNWLQVNINSLQSGKLIKEFGFPGERVLEIGTCVSDEFFSTYTQDDVKQARLRMGYILSNGNPVLQPIPIDEHFQSLDHWMSNQTPRIIGTRSGLSVDPTSDHLIYLLQPTRIVARKRIERNIHLLSALVSRSSLGREFERNKNLQLVLHITGPTPIEHQLDHERVLNAYQDLIGRVSTDISERIFVALSVGNEEHPSFQQNNFQRLGIEDIYRMASAVVFPSETEGRGLPIIESSACGIPIICSRYHPEEVFSGVIGENLPKQQQIQFIEFPEGDFSETFLDDVANLLLKPESNQERVKHNIDAVRSRYSFGAFEEILRNVLDILRKLG